MICWVSLLMSSAAGGSSQAVETAYEQFFGGGKSLSNVAHGPTAQIHMPVVGTVAQINPNTMLPEKANVVVPAGGVDTFPLPS